MKVITDIQEPFVTELSSEEKEFWENITIKNYPKNENETDSAHAKRVSEWKDSFLYMNKELRQNLMNKELNKIDEEIVFEHGCKRAFQYSNSGQKQLKIIRKFSPFIKIFAYCSFAFLLVNVFQETYIKNRQLKLETVTGEELYELIPGKLRKINNSFSVVGNGGLFGEVEKVMTYDNYINHITKPNFKCGEIKSLLDSFNNNALPLCKTNSMNDTYIVANIKHENQTKQIMNVIHEGKIYNVDLDESFFKIKGAETVNFDRIQYSFVDAFPELVRSYSINSITKNKQQ